MSAKCVHCNCDLSDADFERGDFCERCDKLLSDQMPDEEQDGYERWLLENEDDPTMEGWTP